jgi:hypothetical protein
METTNHPSSSLRWLVPAALALALAVRLPTFVATDFPINDGAMFFSMVRDLIASDLRLPAFTTYNGGTIPFAYPPLGLYLAAVLAKLGIADPAALVRYLPLLANLATIAAFCFLALELLGRGRAAAFACLLFPLLPYSFQWVTMGGGVTRSFGFLFALLTAMWAHRAAVRGDPWHAAAAGGATAAAVLSHPEAGLFACATLALMFLLYRRDRAGLLQLLLVAASVVALTAPWWGMVLARHGPGPFLAASRTSEWSLSFVVALGMLALTAEPLLSVTGVLAALGLFAELARGRWLLPAWTVLTLAVVPRSAHTPLTMPFSLAAGVALAEVILPALDAFARGCLGHDGGGVRRRLLAGFRRAVPPVLAGWVLGYGILSNWTNFNLGRAGTRCLMPPERIAMAWVAAHTPPASTFVVVSAPASWFADAALEWFPTLSARRCLNTVQGAEWLPGGEYARRQELYAALKPCTDPGCLERAAARQRSRFSHVYVSKTQTGPFAVAPLWQAMLETPGWQLAFDNGGASVFARIGGTG